MTGRTQAISCEAVANPAELFLGGMRARTTVDDLGLHELAAETGVCFGLIAA